MVNSIGNSIVGGVGLVGIVSNGNGGGMIVTQNGGPIGNGNSNNNNGNSNNNSSNMGNSTPATPTQNCQSIRYCCKYRKREKKV